MKNTAPLAPKANALPLPAASQLFKLYAFTSDLLCTFTASGEFLWINPAVQKLWGYKPEELMGRSYKEWVVEEDLPRTEEALWNLRQGTDLPYFENRYQRKDGGIIPMVWSATWDATEEVVYCIAHDATALKTQEALKTEYKQTVQRQHREMHQMLERITDMFFSMDNCWRITYLNTQVENVLGIRREDYTGRSFWECFPDMVGSLYDEQYHCAVRTGTPVHFEAYFPPFKRWFEVSAYPSPTGLSVFFRDINARKQYEAERKVYEENIQQQNRQLVSVLERINQGFISLNARFQVLYWNHEAEVTIGIPREAIIGKNICEFYTEEALAVYGPLFLRVQQEQQPLHTELVCPMKGTWIEFSIFPSEEGFSVFFKDIDIRKQAERELQKLSLIARETDEIVVITDTDSRILWANESFERTTGYRLEEATGRRYGELFRGPETDPKMVQYIHQQLREGEAFTVEVLHYSKTGQPYWLEIHAQPFRVHQGTVVEYFTIQRNITERKQWQYRLYEEQRQRQQMVTAAAVKAQEQERALVGRELHDNVNQVLTTIKLYLELCRDGVGDTSDLLHKSIGLAQASINEIRNLSKRLSAPTLGNIKLKESVKDLIENVVQTNQLDIHLEAAAIEELQIDQDAHLAVYRILQEQLTNILKYAQARQVQVVMDRTDHTLVLTITDDGRGFDPEQKSKGIGITNMKARAENLGGTFVLRSAPERGCRLEVRLPLEA